MPNIIILTGNIGSGKTTLAKEYVKQGYVCVSRDSVRTMFAAGGYTFSLDTEPLVRNIERYSLRLLLQEGLDIVVDETHVSRKTRANTIYLGQEYEYDIVSHVLPKISKKEAVKRRMEDNDRGTPKAKWEKIWDTFNKSYKEPELKEGLQKIILEQKTGKSKIIEEPPGSKERYSRD